MKCPDCQGSGQYKGFDITPEPCQKCKGVGTLDERGQPHTLESIRPKGDSIANWMEDHKDRLGEFNLIDVTHKIKPIKKDNTSPLQIGDDVYVYDGTYNSPWFKCTLALGPKQSGIRPYQLRYTNGIAGYMQVSRGQITFNLTQNRWEYIRNGPPRWP